MSDVSEIAKYILYLNKLETEQAGDEAASDIDPMKLQKLLYYCQGYSLGLMGKPLFADPIEAWQYGPVIRKVYQEFKKYKGQCIPLGTVSAPPPVDEWTVSIAQMVMGDKSRYSATALMRMTHEEPAWKEAWVKTDTGDRFPCEELSQQTMRKFFEEELTKEGSNEEESRLWESIGYELTEKEAAKFAISLG